MARARKSETREMAEAAQKIAGLKSIDPVIDLQNGVTVAALQSDLDDSRAALEDYNSTLSLVDEKLNALNAANLKLRATNKKILPAIGLKFGTDSSEYEKVGGVRDSERARPTKKPKPPQT